MSNLILDNIYLILLLPLWVFLIIMGARFFAVYVNNKIIYLLTLLSSLLGCFFCIVNYFKLDSALELCYPFVKIGNFVLNFGLHIDKLSLIFAIVLFAVSFCVQLFSIPYLKTEPKKYRFFAYLNMFNFSMAGLLFSPNLFQMYFFWELVGVMSYLLIGFDYKSEEKSVVSKRVFLINRFGDTALISAIIITSYFMYNYGGNLFFTSLDFADINVITVLLYAYTSTPLFYLVCALFITGAAVKSAQFPFHTWLQDAMQAKLPVSALLHSATMVAAGVYLLIRLLPLFTLEMNLLTVISWIGILTALICGILACIETQPKKVLAYSTSANLGLMFMAVALQDIRAALIFFAAHAFIKSMLFLSMDENENYINFITFLIGGLSLSGLIFSGVISKELLFEALKNNSVLSVLYCIASFLTAFYIIRIALLMIKEKVLINKINYAKYVPIVILLLMNIYFYFFIKDKVSYKIAEPFWIAIVGWIVAYLCYRKKLLEKWNETPKMLEKFYYEILPSWYNKFSKGLEIIDTKVFSNYKPIIFVSKSSVKFAGLIEKNIMNKSVSLTADGAKMFSLWWQKLQCKNVQIYNAYAFIIITIIICLVIISYKLMLNLMS